jgi:hypothetical protein
MRVLCFFGFHDLGSDPFGLFCRRCPWNWHAPGYRASGRTLTILRDGPVLPGDLDADSDECPRCSHDAHLPGKCQEGHPGLWAGPTFFEADGCLCGDPEFDS